MYTLLLRVIRGYRTISYDSVYAISGFPPIDITILHDIAFRENLSASSISNYNCILSPFFIPHFSERNTINIVQFSDKSAEDFFDICYTDDSKIDGRVGFTFVVFRSGVESENFQFRIRDECTVFVAELLCLNFAVKWITEQNSVLSEYIICTDSLSSLDSLKCTSSSNNKIVEIQKQLKSLKDKNISIDFAFVRGHTAVLGNERANWLAKAATKRKIDIDVNIPKSFYKKITKERMVKSWNQEYLISNKGSITKKFFPTINKRLSYHHFYTNYKLTQFLTGHGIHCQQQYTRARPNDTDTADGQNVDFECHVANKAGSEEWNKEAFMLEKLTVWCALCAGGIIGPYFFKNDEGHNVTVNGDRYRAMITNFFIPELNNHDVQELWFRQDGATYHTARATID
ncbi:RNase H domain-containing protein [Trichonephila clavipes]|nr:RNase H domain-containing protein [Trichonephila clavipes]